jgi:hypothetical protein
MALKTYVLLPVMDADAPVYQKTADDQRIQVKKIPVYRPYVRMSFQDENGVGKVIRYKANAFSDGKPVIDQRVQIDKLKIEANEPFTRIEMRDLEFKHGVLLTTKLVAQEYLENYPAFEGFKGTCDEIRQPEYKLLDTEADSKLKNEDIRLRVKAASKVINLDLEQSQAMLIRLNGSFFQTPNDVVECQNMLMVFIDDAEEEGLKAVLKDEKDNTVDEKTTVLIGQLINAKLLSFEDVDGKISKKDKDGKWITVRDMSAEYSLDERKRLFSDFLNTEDGKALKLDLENDFKAISKPKK